MVRSVKFFFLVLIIRIIIIKNIFTPDSLSDQNIFLQLKRKKPKKTNKESFFYTVHKKCQSAFNFTNYFNLDKNSYNNCF